MKDYLLKEMGSEAWANRTKIHLTHFHLVFGFWLPFGGLPVLLSLPVRWASFANRDTGCRMPGAESSLISDLGRIERGRKQHRLGRGALAGLQQNQKYDHFLV